MKPLFPSLSTARTIQRDIVKRQDALLEQSRTIAKKASKVSDLDEHAQRLVRLGFTHAHELRERSRIIDDSAKYAADTIHADEAARKYPGFRFVSSKVMNDVCKDYGLVITTVDRYLGRVPDFAAKAIENSGIIKSGFEVICQYSLGGSAYREGFYDTEAEAKNSIRHKYVGLNSPRYSVRPAMSHVLHIAAPSKAVRLNDHEEIVGNRIVKKDPIVMVNVSGGYVVLTAWDEEGRDPRILNPASN